MASGFTGGAGGLFSGLAQGLQLLVALRNAEENQRIARERTGLMRNKDTREQAAFDEEQANKPYTNIQDKVLAPQNITASLPDIRREYTPTPVGDTFQPTTTFQPPAFGEAPQQSGPPAPVPSLNTSHMAQVLERARRQSTDQRKLGTLQDVLTAAAQRAQQTQLPVSGAFKDQTGATAELPGGFSAQPDRTFTPYQYGAGSSRDADRLARAITMLRSRIPARALELLDLGTTKPGAVAKLFPGAQADLRHLVELQAQYERAIGAVNAGAGRSTVDTAASQQQIDWDNAAAALRAQGKNPEDVLGPRP